MIKSIAKRLLPVGRKDLGFQYLSPKEVARFLDNRPNSTLPMWSEGRLSSGKMHWGDILHMERYGVASVYCHKGWILDFASGPGYGSEILRRMGKNGIRIDGMDADYKKIAYSRTRFLENRSIQWYFDGELPYQDESLDGVVSIETLEHLEDDEAFVHEAHRCLKTGGYFVFSVPIEDEIPEYQLQDPLGHKRTYTEESAKELALSVFGNVEILEFEGGPCVMGACEKK